MNAAEFLLGEAALQRHGARPAIVCGEHTISYRELAADVCRAANALRSLGVRPGDRVLLLMRDTPEYAAAWLGAVRAGAVVVGLNTRLPETDYRHILADSAARVAIVEDVFADARPDLSAELAREGRLVVSGAAHPGGFSWREANARAAPEGAAFDATPDDPAFWMYSSGTTGRPKGIIHTHRGVLAVGQAFRELGLAGGDTIFTTSKFFFAYGLEHGLLGALAFGLTSVVYPDWPNAQVAIDIVARYRPVAVFSVPSFYRSLLAEPAARLAPFGAVRFFVSAGERLPESMVEQWRATVRGEILSLYGMSETFCACMLTPPGTSGAQRSGLPLALTEVRLLDAQGREPAPGEPGVLWLRHPALALGYANRPEATREQFVDGWFCTRDVFVRDAQGFYLHQGRTDELMKVAGQWVQPGELEDVVAGLDPIAEAACVAGKDADGFERLALFVAAHGDDAGAAVAAAERACAEKLPRHKRPKWIVPIDALPRTATGKVQRFKLRELLSQERAAKA